MNVSQSETFVKAITQQIIVFMTVMSWGLANALNMKYTALRETEMAEEEVKKIIDIDRTIYEAWKRSLAKKAFPNFPQKHAKLLPTFDWDGALRSLDSIYYKQQDTKGQYDE
jgi:hypothetical protein